MRPSLRKYIVAGLVTAIPVWITWLLISFIFGLITDAGLPVVGWLVSILKPIHPTIAGILVNPVFQSILAIIIIIVILYFLGWLATKVIGRRILGVFEKILDKIPMVKTVYGGSKRILESFQQKPDEAKRVVLINYPSPEMKTIGLITRTIVDKESGKQLAAVYVPTTPNPTSGFLEIVPMEDVIFTNWPVNEAIAFIVSGGVVGPDKIDYSASHKYADENNGKPDNDKIDT